MELDYKELKNSEIYLDVELQFADIYEKINIYKDGEWKVFKE